MPIDTQAYAVSPLAVPAQGTMRVVAIDDATLAEYFEFFLGPTFVALKPVVGDFRVQDANDVDESDYIQFRVDDASALVEVITPGVPVNPIDFGQPLAVRMPVNVTTGLLTRLIYVNAVTLTGPVTGLQLDLLTNVTLNGKNLTGLDIALPAAYGAGDEYGIHTVGGGGTFNALYSVGAAALTAGYFSDGTFSLTIANGTYAGFLTDGTRTVTLSDTTHSILTNYWIHTALPAAATAGTIWEVAWAVATTLLGPTIGLSLDMSTNVTINAQDLMGINVVMPGYAAGTEYAIHAQSADGYQAAFIEGQAAGVPSAGWFTDGTRITKVCDATHAILANDEIHISLPTAKTSGTIIETAWGAAVTLAGATVGLNVDCLTNVTLNGKNLTGVLIQLPAAYGAGDEYAIRATGGGGTVSLLGSVGAGALYAASFTDGTRIVEIANGTEAIHVTAGIADFSHYAVAGTPLCTILMPFYSQAGDPALAANEFASWIDTGTGFYYWGGNPNGAGVKKVQIS